ncbi:MAG TPA: homoserine kinase [Terriglobia bacterium]
MADSIAVRVPATSANLGCLFDCGALALGLYLDVRVGVRTDHNVTVRYRGETPKRVASDETNLVVRTIRETLGLWGVQSGFDLEIENQIPVGVGLGSSAAAIVAALAASRWLGDHPLVDEAIISLAGRHEGHPDNVAAAWEGGFTLAVQAGDKVVAYSCAVPDSLQFALVVPDYAVPTEKARAVLPDSYRRADAVHNLQRAAAVVAEFFSGRVGLCQDLFNDRWHQPYRAGLMPGLDEALHFTHPDVLGVCLSGAGPSILALVRGNALAVGQALQKLLARHGVQSRPFALAADNRGAKGWSQPCCG